MKNTKIKCMLAVAALLAVGLALMLYYAAHKQGYHVDELYTYELANYPGGFYALEDGYMDSWHDGSFYSAVLTPVCHGWGCCRTLSASWRARRCCTARRSG